MRDYLRDGRRHSAITTWHWKKARQLLLVNAGLGWQMSAKWPDRLIETGLAAESVDVQDAERWLVARRLIESPSCFTIAEFRRQLAADRLAALGPVTESAPEDEPRRVVLERFGLSLEESD